MRDIEVILLELRAALEPLESGKMQTRSFEAGLSPCWANCDIENGRLVLVESKLFLREILQRALSTCMPRIQIDSVADSKDIPQGPARLILMGINPRLGLDVGSLRFAVETARALCNDSPVAVVLHDDDPLLVKTLCSLGVVGILQHTTSLAIASAAVRLMMVGGALLQPETICDQSLSFAAQWTQQPPNCATQPEMSELGIESQTETALTARERDVLKILRKGRQNKTIAFELGIAESTVKVHLHKIMKKLHVSNRTQVALGAGAMEQVLSPLR
jgi:DNA-binding NarL/FixJ family response regulator